VRAKHGMALDSMPRADVPTSLGMDGYSSLGGRAKVKVEPSPPPRGVPGYKGYLPGSQHHYGRSFGTTVAELEPCRRVDNKYAALERQATDPRPSPISRYTTSLEQPAEGAMPITTGEGTPHIPGYAGFLPGLDADVGARFATRTRGNLVEVSAAIPGVRGTDQTEWMPMGDIHKAMGAPRPSEPPEPPRATQDGRYLAPGQTEEGDIAGYSGFHPGQQHVYGRSQAKNSALLKARQAETTTTGSATLVGWAPPSVVEKKADITTGGSAAATSADGRYHLLRHISTRTGILSWLRFTYDFEIGSAQLCCGRQVRQRAPRRLHGPPTGGARQRGADRGAHGHRDRPRSDGGGAGAAPAHGSARGASAPDPGAAARDDGACGPGSRHGPAARARQPGTVGGAG
jgi:hypothetical protein